MTFRHGKSATLLVGKYNLSPFVNEVTPSMSIDTAETSTFASSAKTYIVGQNDGTISVSGLFDGGANAIEAIYSDIIDNDLTPVITVAYDGGAIGSKCTIAQGKQTSYEIGIPVGDVVSLNGEFQVTGGLRQGVLLADGTALSSTTNGTAVDNTTSSTIGATANLHITANSRSSTTVIKVQHSADNSTWVDLITFTTVGIGATTSQVATASGTINRYLRAQTTLSAGTGSITLSVAVARRNN